MEEKYINGFLNEGYIIEKIADSAMPFLKGLSASQVENIMQRAAHEILRRIIL